MAGLAGVVATLVATLGSTTITPADAVGVQACAAYPQLRDMLVARFGEEPASSGRTADGTVVQLFASDSADTWTMVNVEPGGRACVVAVGRDWRALLEFDPRSAGVSLFSGSYPMHANRYLLAGHLGLACLLAASAVQAQTAGQQPQAGTEMPSTQHQQDVLKPVPDMQGSGGGTGQAQGNEAASPTAGAAAAAAPEGPCGVAMPATKHQEETMRTAQDCPDQGGIGTTTGPTGEVRTQEGGQTTQP